MTFTTLIDVAALRGMLGDPTVAVIDCRFDLMNPDAGLRAYLHGHIPGARFADLNKDLSAPVHSRSGRHPLPAPDILAATLSRLGIGNQTQVVAYDDNNGSFAARLWWLLRWVGHGSVAVLDGGLKAWSSAGGALAAGDESLAATGRAPASFEAHVDSTAVADADDVAAVLKDPHKILVDARAAERFTGAVEPIDTVAGHIPGAVNHPLSGNLADDGRFLDKRLLRERWLERLGGRSPENLVAMCGSGVTACHNLISLEIASLGGARLYPGSWSEWIRDPTRPTAKGL